MYWSQRVNVVNILSIYKLMFVFSLTPKMPVLQRKKEKVVVDLKEGNDVMFNLSLDLKHGQRHPTHRC